MAILDVRAITKHFRGLVAVNAVSFSIGRGTVTALVGPNGAGKTTCFNLVAGALPPSKGQVLFEGEAITGRAPEDVCRRGIARTFQVVRPMKEMTVEENVMIGAFSWTNRVDEARHCARDVLLKVGLGHKAGVVADHLTLPDRKMLELCRALATRPKLLMLDEVMAGLRPREADHVVELLRTLNREGLTILLVEHVMRIVMSIADRVIVLHHGECIADGTPAEVTSDPVVIDSYLGRNAHGGMPA